MEVLKWINAHHGWYKWLQDATFDAHIGLNPSPQNEQ
jgi:hypothetical protein